MSRFLFWLLIILLVYVWWQKLRRPPPSATPSHRPSEGESMLACAHCGVFIPQSEAIVRQGQYFCSNAHAELGVTRPHSGDNQS